MPGFELKDDHDRAAVGTPALDDWKASKALNALPPSKAPDERDPDADLVARVGARDPLAVRVLVTSKLPRLIALASRMLGDRADAEDVAQEAFVRIWKQAPHWRTGEAKFDTWLHRVALNLCYDRLRGRREESVEDPHNVAEPAPDPAGAPDQQLEARTRDERVRAALAALPVRQREALVLTYYQELSNLEAAGLMGISVDALESLLARARRTLRAQLAGDAAGKDSV
ncbi:MAG TPA: RNA polymerase sigma factor [Paraburkholderia sp.]|uniref:RNA polymerase sigma factor n=1 Tax=Paraburkholderia sp. TaxID=1926495 RepID=UPI002B6CA7F8|nr:RNA polymerase sigma factor [Paraburkholderia sp.]HTR06277.1 RNA polymerase sigma factor [Paraburkholderia sp.]